MNTWHILKQQHKSQIASVIQVMIVGLIGIFIVAFPIPVIAGVLGGIAIILLTIIQPLFGLAITLMVAPIGVGIDGLSVDIGQIFLFMTLFSWVARNLAQRWFIIPQTPLNIPLLLFIFITLIALLWAPSLILGAKEILKWVEILFLIWMVMTMTSNQENMLLQDHRIGFSRISLPRYFWIVVMLLLPGFVQSLLGIWQFAFSRAEPAHFLVLDRFYRASGTFDQPNPFGGFVNLTLFLGIGVFVGVVLTVKSESGTRSFQAFRQQVNLGSFVFLISFILFVSISFLALIMSWSRGAWLGFVAGGFVFILFLPRNRWEGTRLILKLCMITVILVVFLAFLRPGLLPGYIVDRFVSGISQGFKFLTAEETIVSASNYAVAERMAYWRAALEMAKSSVWLGIGFGNFGAVYQDFATLRWENALGHAHNYYLNLLAEVGVIGLTGYLVFWVVVMWQSVYLLNRLDWPYRGIVLGLLAAWVALTVHNLVDKLYVRNIYIYIGVMLGLLQVMASVASSKLSENKDSLHLNSTMAPFD